MNRRAPHRPGSARRPRLRPALWLRRRWRLLVGAVTGVVLVYVTLWILVPAQLLSVAPGPTPDVASLVLPADGAADVDPDRGPGRFLLTTVLALPGTPLELGKALVRSDVELHARSALVPRGMDDATYTDWTLAAMADSQITAAWQAWEFLGHQTGLASDGGTVFWVSTASPATGQVKAGDLITSWSLGAREERFVSSEQFGRTLRQAYAELTPGEDRSDLVLNLHRGATPVRVSFPISQHDLATWPILGLALGGDGLRTEPPVPVSFPPGDIGGPSGGLLLALQIIDDFTPGDLTGGQIVAGSGTIGPAGGVGPVGGVTMKLRAAVRAGATVFLVPSQDYEAARRVATALGLSLRLVPVTTLSEACRAISTSESRFHRPEPPPYPYEAWAALP